MTIEEILQLPAAEAVKELKKRNSTVPEWKKLKKEFDPKEHDVMNHAIYPDVNVGNGKIKKVCRIALPFQKLAAKRMTGLAFGIPVKVSISSESEGEKKAAAILKKILKKNRIDSVNLKRFKRLFSECEVLTLWYAREEPNSLYGESSKLKLRCKTYSPALGHSIYPLYDEFGDMVALSVGYTVDKVDYLDVYSKNKHILYKKDSDGWIEEENEPITIEKIPAVYSSRVEPIWEDLSGNISEMEFTLSRNGNYIKKNSKPIIGIFADEEIPTGNEGDDDDKSVFQYPAGSEVKYITWDQATDSIKFQIEQLQSTFFKSLQLPDISHENMKTTPMSGESRKMMFIDAQMKVLDEAGDLIEFLDREINVIKAFMKVMFPTLKNDIDSLQVDAEIVPYQISDEKENVDILTTATGGKAIMSQKEAIDRAGYSSDSDATLTQIKEEEKVDSFNLSE